jgi:hypothetical protein
MFTIPHHPSLDHVLMKEAEELYVLIGNPKARDHLKHLLRIILKLILWKVCKGVVWIHLNRDRIE